MFLLPRPVFCIVVVAVLCLTLIPHLEQQATAVYNPLDDTNGGDNELSHIIRLIVNWFYHWDDHEDTFDLPNYIPKTFVHPGSNYCNACIAAYHAIWHYQESFFGTRAPHHADANSGPFAKNGFIEHVAESVCDMLPHENPKHKKHHQTNQPQPQTTEAPDHYHDNPNAGTNVMMAKPPPTIDRRTSAHTSNKKAQSKVNLRSPADARDCKLVISYMAGTMLTQQHLNANLTQDYWCRIPGCYGKQRFNNWN